MALTLWLTLVLVRPIVIEPYCDSSPKLCHRSQVNSFDAPSIRKINFEWSFRSDWTQYMSGILAVGGPAAWHATWVIFRSVHPVLAMSAFASDFLIAFQAVAWSGVFTEASKLIFQRPRPFVYSHPHHQGHLKAYASYTSFYSGHTSFTAATGTVHFLTLLSRGASFGWLISSFILFLGLTLSTAVGRVLSAAHFPSDVIVGAMMGTIVAGFFFYHFRKKPLQFKINQRRKPEL